MIELNRIYNEDCLDGMKRIPDKSVDMILCDLPYGTTACKWDNVIPFEPLWEQYERIIKDNGAIVLTASQPFTTKLINSNMELFKYEWIWEKSRTVGFLNAKNAPLKKHENVCVFSKGKTANCNKNNMIYNPQGLIEINKVKKSVKPSDDTVVGNRPSRNKDYVAKYTGYPTSIIKFNNENKQIHPTQKPVALFEYLIRTYTNEGDLVLDNCIGSGTTAIACINTDRNYIGFEIDKQYCDISNERIQRAMQDKEETP
jgi:site-specific DNA-methyltransferase (adenine-specific)